MTGHRKARAIPLDFAAAPKEPPGAAKLAEAPMPAPAMPPVAVTPADSARIEERERRAAALRGC